MVEVDAQKRSASVHIGWNEGAEKNSKNVTIFRVSNQVITVTPLYGAVVGVGDGPNEFSVSYVDSDDWTPPVRSDSARCFYRSSLLLTITVTLLHSAQFHTLLQLINIVSKYVKRGCIWHISFKGNI